METPEHVIFHYRPMVCMGLGIAVGIFLSGSVSGTGLIMALCLFPLFSGIGIYFGFKGAALFAFGCAAGLLRTLFGPVSLPYGLMYPFEHMRAELSYACASLFWEHAPLLNAMLWGVKGNISDSVYDAFRSCGIAHILALSGLHVSFVVGALNRLTRRALPKVKFYTSIVVLFAYCAIAAFPASLIRASVMSLCGLYAAAAGRRYDMPSGIAFSAIVILLADPAALYSIGFELSFGAVIMISLLMRPVTELLSFLPLPIAQMAALSVCGTLGTLPLSVYYFGTIPVLGLFANTLILPIVPFVFLSAMAVNLIGAAMPRRGKGAVLYPDVSHRRNDRSGERHILRVICGKAGRHNAACMLIRVSRLLRGIRPAAGFPLKKVRRMRRIAVCGCAVYAVVWIYGIMLIWII